MSDGPRAPDEGAAEDVVPKGPSSPSIRISNAERQEAIAILQEAVVDGRLTLEEYSDRVGVAVGARTDQDLEALARLAAVSAHRRADAHGTRPRARGRAPNLSPVRSPIAGCILATRQRTGNGL